MSSDGQFLKAFSFSLCYSSPARPKLFLQEANNLWDELNCNRLHFPINFILFDTSLTYGAPKSVRWLREAVGSLAGIRSVSCREDVDSELISSVNYAPHTHQIALKLIYKRLLEESIHLRTRGCPGEHNESTKHCSVQFGRIADLMRVSMGSSA